MKKHRQQPSGRKLRPILLATALLLLCGGWFVVPGIPALSPDRRAPHPEEESGQNASPKAAEEIIRGNIYDRRGTPVAVTLPLYSVYVKPVELSIGSEQMAFLATVLNLAPDSLDQQLKSERSVVWLARYISPQIADEVRKQNIHGLYLIDEPQRYYPGGTTGSHVVGCFKEGHGLSGIEFSLDQVLQRPDPGSVPLDPQGRHPEGSDPGSHVILQLDTGLQKTVERKLAALQKSTSAQAVWAVVMQPDSGAVLAMANRPTYDPNRFWEFSEEALVNRAEKSRLSLGSLERIFQLAEVLDSGKGLEETDSGSTEFKKNDEWRRGSASDEFVSDSLWRLIAHFPTASSREVGKFFSPQPGSASSKRENGPDVNTLQLLSGFSALVNGGRLPKPHMVKAFYGRAGAVPAEKEAVQTVVLKAETSGILRALLTSGSSHAVLLATLQEKSHEPQEEPDRGKRELAAKDLGPSEGGRFDAVMLGYIASDQGDAVLAIVLQDGCNAAGFGAKGFRIAGEAILKKSAATLAVAPPPTVPIQEMDLAAIYHSWRAIQERLAGKDQNTPPPVRKVVMPQVTGLSLRKALHILQPLQVSYSVEGSGVVVAQKPKAGALLKDRRVRLRLRPDSGSIRSM